jgi:hypothetical protein
VPPRFRETKEKAFYLQICTTSGMRACERDSERDKEREYVCARCKMRGLCVCVCACVCVKKIGSLREPFVLANVQITIDATAFSRAAFARFAVPITL